MASSEGSASPSGGMTRRLAGPVKVLIVSSVMFTFISYWRTAAVVLCDLASTAYYIGGIVENAIGPAAPWFILAVMVFSYAVRSVYLESCSLFVRGGVYRVVKEAMGGFLAKLSVSALMFDYILTGPTSGVSAGTYIMGLLVQAVHLLAPNLYNQLHLGESDTIDAVKRYGAVLIAVGITLYFLRQNLLGIHESSDKALKIMYATTVMAVIMLVWCGITLAFQGPVNSVPLQPNLDPKVEYATVTEPDPQHPGEPIEKWQEDAEGHLVPKVEDGQPVPKANDALKEVKGVLEWFGFHPQFSTQDDPLGFLGRMGVTSPRHPASWLSFIGLIGLFIGFGHSILAMSGEETLAQVYREVESPKMPNFKKAAFIVFVYSLALTAGISFMAVLLIPTDVRMKFFSDNLIGGLARFVLGPPLLKLFLEIFVVIIGFLILAGAVNTAIIGSNGVLNRVAEDGVLPDWFLKPHPRFGTTYRLLWLIAILQLAVVILSGGDMIILGEAYAFGVVWSFVFKALAMVVLRFKDRSPREFKVPLNVKVGDVEVPVGLGLIFLVLLITAILNFFTKEVATVSGVIFTLLFLSLFMVSEHYHEKRRAGGKHEHMEQFNRATADEITPASLGLTHPYRKLVSIRSPQNLSMLEKALQETDPDTTSVVVMTAKVTPLGDTAVTEPQIDAYDRELMTAVVHKAENAGKEVTPLIIQTNNPLHTVLKTAKDLQVHELVMGASNKWTADEQLEQIAFIWISLHEGQTAPLTVRILSRERDMYLDLAGGNRIPKVSERARTVAELRAAGVGIDRALLIHDGSSGSSDLFQAVMTMLDDDVALGLVCLVSPGGDPHNGPSVVQQDCQRAEKLGRHLQVFEPAGDAPAEIVRLAREGQYDVIILGLPQETSGGLASLVDRRAEYLLKNAHCRVFLAAAPQIPQEIVDTGPAPPAEKPDHGKH
jgi:amino acid transporter/nucleotide-binding universal stress UspA family protein